MGRENSSTGRGKHASGSQLRQRLNWLKDKYRKSDSAREPSSAEPKINKNELSPSDVTPPLSALKEESHILADARDFSAIEPKEQPYPQHKMLRPERYEKDGYEAYDVMFKPLPTKDDELGKFGELGTHPKSIPLNEPQIGYKVAKDEDRQKIDNSESKVDADESGFEHQPNGRNRHAQEFKPPVYNNTVLHEPKHYDIDRSNVMINYWPPQASRVESKRIAVSQPQIGNLLDKSKSSDYELQPVKVNFTQKNNRDEAEGAIERSQTKTETTAIPARERAPYQQAETRRFVNQKAKHNTNVPPKLILRQLKRPVVIAEARSYHYTQKHREDSKEADTNKRLAEAEETVRALREELARKDTEAIVTNNNVATGKREFELIKDELARTRLENANVISSNRKAADRVDELNSQLDAARLRLQSTSDKFGRLIDYIYRLNDEKHLKVLEDIVGGKGRTDLDDVYRKNEDLKRKLADMTDLMYMSRDRTLIEKLEELHKRK